MAKFQLFKPFKPMPARRAGLAMLAAFSASMAAMLVFQFLTMHPRPEALRGFMAAYNFSAFPSGVAATALSVAVVAALNWRRWAGGTLAVAAFIGVSEVFWGHSPAAVVAGAVLGGSLGAAGFGLAQPRPEWRWLLWPQAAIAVVVSQIAYLDLLPLDLLRWPLADKVLHFLLFGAIAFWLNLWLNGRTVKMWWLVIPVAILLPITIALLDEGVQWFSPLRSADLLDLSSDLAGMLFFWGLSCKIGRITPKPAKTGFI